jgi:hypothetical protein
VWNRIDEGPILPLACLLVAAAAVICLLGPFRSVLEELSPGRILTVSICVGLLVLVSGVGLVLNLSD